MSHLVDHLPRISYNVTRTFRGRWFSPIVILGIIFVLGILIPLNFALVGYETVAIAQSDFNKVPDLWFWRFGFKPLPGSQCDNRTLNVGETFITNYTLLTWTVEAIFGGPPLSSSGSINLLSSLPTMDYTGKNLDSCDIASMSVFTATQPPVLTFEALVLCNDTDFPVLMSTVYTESFATDEHSLYDLIPGNVTNPGFRLYSYFLDLGTDLLDSGLAGQFSSAGSTITILEPPVFCHNQRLGAIDQSCTAVPVDISSASSILTSINGTIYRVWTSELPEPLLGIMTSATQLFLAVVRLDIGNAFPNNFLVHPDTLNATISSNITLYGDCLDTLQQMDSVFPGLGDMSRPATIASQYLCHFPHRKPLGSAIISVLVATLTMFGSGWTVFLLVAKLYEQRKYPQGKSCDCHLSEYERVGNNELQEGYGSVSLQGPRRDGV